MLPGLLCWIGGFVKRIVALLLLLGGASPSLAGAELILRDGQTLQGVDVKRADDRYLLELASGDVLTLPISLVRHVRLTGDDVPSPENDAARKLRGPSGIVRADPQVLAGEPVRPVRPSEQLEVFGEPARFRHSPVEPGWTPRPAFDNETDVLGPSRSRWQEDIVDPLWTPCSAFDFDSDVLRLNRSRWQEDIIDPSWRPADGFRKRKMPGRSR
jgi:hypothetical protein